MGGKRVKLQIWDTAGQERFRSVTRSYYRGSAAVLLVFDVTSRETYNHVSQWLADARNLGHPNALIMLVGGKSDLAEEREVTYNEAARFAQENEILFTEVSAKTGDGVEECFLKCTHRIFSNFMEDPEKMPAGIQVRVSNASTPAIQIDNSKRKGNCC
jgi:small GTP-binding protein